MANEVIKNFLKHKEESGENSITIAEMETLLASEDEIIPIELKKLDLEHQRKMLMLQMAEASIQKSQIEHFKAIISMGQNALKSIVMINGGATVAFIAFMNNNLAHFLKTGELTAVYVFLWEALIAFGIGTLFAGMGIGASYFAQGSYARAFEQQVPTIRKWAQDGGELNLDFKISYWHIITIGLCLVSYLCTFLGIFACAMGFSTLF